tara:strand:- start:779 stop:1447 length:669 start_codon:yes stop_codon:yes gene_type:complete
MERRNLILGGVALVGLGGWAISSQLTGNAPQDTPVPTGQGAGNDTNDFGITEMVLGNPDAAVTMIEYASYTCPHCARFHAGPYNQLKADFIDSGKIKFVYREVYFDRYGLWASMVARCGGQERFFGITDLIYKGQSQWTRAGEPAAIVEELRKIGRLSGLENDALEACLQDAEMATTLTKWEEQNRTADGIDSTPSFVINGQKYSNMAYAEMKTLLDTALGG